MTNFMIRIIQSMLIGLLLSWVGYSYKTLEFWIAMIIMALQFAKEQKYDN